MGNSSDRRVEFIERERHVRDLFIQFLKTRKYPDDAIGIEIVIAARFRPDLALVDPGSKELIGLIEITSAIDTLRKVKTNYAVQLLAYRAISKSPSIPLYLVAPDVTQRSNLNFKIFQIEDSGDLVEIPTSDFPSFPALRNTVLAGTIKTVEAKQISAERTLRAISILLALLVGILMVSSVVGWWRPTWEFLALLAGFAFLTILPFTKELRLLGFRLTRLTDDAD